MAVIFPSYITTQNNKIIKHTTNEIIIPDKKKSNRGRKKEIYSYDLSELAKALGITYKHLSDLRAQLKIDPADLTSIIKYVESR